MAADVCNFYNFYFCVSLFTFSSGIIWNYIVRVKLGKLILGTRSDDFVVEKELGLILGKINQFWDLLIRSYQADWQSPSETLENS